MLASTCLYSLYAWFIQVFGTLESLSGNTAIRVSLWLPKRLLGINLAVILRDARDGV